jgi:phosphocarrier protein
MNGEPLRRTITITNPQGLHMRPITAFVEAAAKFRCDVFIRKGSGEPINGKSPFALLGLAAEEGTQLTVLVSGEDAQDALDKLIDILVNFKEEEE